MQYNINPDYIGTKQKVQHILSVRVYFINK